MSKIVFFDIDGTLFYPGVGIPESALQAVDQLIANGNRAILCTGRAMGMIPDEYMDLGFHGMVCAGGAHIVCEGNELLNRTIRNEYLKKVIDWGRKERVGTVLEGLGGTYYDEEMLEEPFFNQVVKQLFEDTTPKNYPIDDNVNKVNKWTYHHANPERTREIEAMVDHTMRGIYHVETNAIEFVASGISKGTGAQTVIDYFGMNQKDSYGFGDSANDIELLEYVNYGIAMGNAVPELSKMAKYHTEAAYEDGIANALERFKLI